MPDLTMYGTPTCADCVRSRALLDSLGIGYDWVDIAADSAAAARAQEISGRTSTPVIALPDGSVLVEPSDSELSAKLRDLGLA